MSASFADQHIANEIQCAPGILEQLSALAVQGFLRLRHGGLEVGGILFGSREPGLIRIEAYRELECEHAFGPAFRLSEADWDRFADLLARSAADQDLVGMVPVGWYVSHTRTGLNLTETDREVFERYLTDPLQVALVLKPDTFQPTRAAWFFAGQEEPVSEFTIAVGDADEDEELGDTDEPQPSEVALPVSEESEPLTEEPSGGAFLEIGAGVYDGAQDQYQDQYRDAPDPVEAAVEEVVAPPRGRRMSPFGYAAAAFLVSAIIAASAGFLWMHMSPRLSSNSAPPSEIRPTPIETLPERAQAQPPPADPALPPVTAAQTDRNLDQPGSGAVEPPTSTVGSSVREKDLSSERVKELERELAALRAKLQSKPEPPPLRNEVRPDDASRSRQTASLRVPPFHNNAPVSGNSARQASPHIDSPALIPVDPSRVVRPATGEALRTLPTPTLSLPAPPPPKPERQPPPAEPATPSHGRLIWTGALRKGDVLFIENGHASSGATTGALPAVPIRMVVSSAEFAGSGIVVYTREPGRNGYSESPGPQNGWNYTVYEYDPERLSDLRVLEAPSARNGWNKLVLRSERKRASLIVIDWELAGAAR